MRILITGSRDWTDGRRISREIWDYALAGRPFSYRNYLVLVHGGCPTGADHLADQLAKWKGLQVERHPADWRLHGKRAGFIRNAEMVALGADVCLAFIRNHSRGATMTADLAEKAGIPTIRFEENDA